MTYARFKGLFSSLTPHWSTPAGLYAELDAEFDFNDDPCPMHGDGGLERPWGTRTFCNPPYGRVISAWIRKGWEESQLDKLVVLLIPSRTDTRWWHGYIWDKETHRPRDGVALRLLPGRLKFGGSKNSAPFPSAVVVFGGEK